MLYWIAYSDTVGTVFVTCANEDADTPPIPSGFTLQGKYKDPLSPDIQPVVAANYKYVYSNGAFQPNPNYDPNTFGIDDARAKRIAYLEEAFASALSGGFKSSAEGTSRTYGYAPKDQQNLMGYQIAVNAGIAPSSIAWKTLDGTQITLTQAQFKTLSADAFNFYHGNYSNWWTKESEVNAATTVDEVNAVVW